jgi:hypothetical protein
LLCRLLVAPYPGPFLSLSLSFFSETSFHHSLPPFFGCLLFLYWLFILTMVLLLLLLLYNFIILVFSQRVKGTHRSGPGPGLDVAH